jgi:hypothetical protein
MGAALGALSRVLKARLSERGAKRRCTSIALLGTELSKIEALSNHMPNQRPQRCNARIRRTDAALYRADRERRVLE